CDIIIFDLPVSIHIIRYSMLIGDYNIIHFVLKTKYLCSKVTFLNVHPSWKSINSTLLELSSLLLKICTNLFNIQ
ncbi:MAG: hypothetical protein ACTSSF_01250, partial [Candidatus Heimdallarchaeaceae archaeon]